MRGTNGAVLLLAIVRPCPWRCRCLCRPSYPNCRPKADFLKNPTIQARYSEAETDAVLYIHSGITLSIALSPRRFVCLDKEEPHRVTSCPMGFYEVADDWTWTSTRFLPLAPQASVSTKFHHIRMQFDLNRREHTFYWKNSQYVCVFFWNTLATLRHRAV